MFTNKPTLHRKLFALIKMLCFFRKKEGIDSHDSRLQQKKKEYCLARKQKHHELQRLKKHLRQSKIKQYSSLFESYHEDDWKRS